MELTDFKVLTFDCYGTLIDWESGIWEALQPMIAAGHVNSRDGMGPNHTAPARGRRRVSVSAIEPAAPARYRRRGGGAFL